MKINGIDDIQGRGVRLHGLEYTVVKKNREIIEKNLKEKNILRVVSVTKDFYRENTLKVSDPNGFVFFVSHRDVDLV